MIVFFFFSWRYNPWWVLACWLNDSDREKPKYSEKIVAPQHVMCHYTTALEENRDLQKVGCQLVGNNKYH